MAVNDPHNPLSSLLDIDFPEIKKANWNVSYDYPTTADVGYVNVVHVDRILANTDIDFDINHASFANPTVSPLYGRYKVKYLAFWAPDRLYMPAWKNGSKMDDDDYPYPVLLPLLDFHGNPNSRTVANQYAGDGFPYVPPTSLCAQLGAYPAYFQPCDWYPTGGDRQALIERACADDSPYPAPSNAFPFLAFWDIYRNYIINTQEPTFPVRTQSFMPETRYVNQLSASATLNEIFQTQPAENPIDKMVTRESLDAFFDAVTMYSIRFRESLESAGYHLDVVDLFYDRVGFDPLCCPKRVYQVNSSLLAQAKPNDFVLRDNFHYGLPIAPLAPDAFTSWISNENVELERTKSSMNIENGKLLMDQWVVASRIQNKVRKMLFKQNAFADYIDTQYGVRPRTDSTIPTFLGAFVSDIVFNDVVSTVQTDDTSFSGNGNLGSRAGYGRGTDNGKSNFVRFKALEPGTFMVLQIILPEVHYFEGRDPMYDKQNFNEEFNPEFDGIGYQDLQKGHLNMVPHLALDPLGRRTELRSWNEYNTPVGQQPYAMEHMTKVNKLGGMFVIPTEYLSWTLARSFNYSRGMFDTQTSSPARTYYSTYPFPEMYTNVFKTSLADNFQFYLSFDYKKYQPISKQFLSFHS